jgi:hypothetical protein
MIFGIDPVSVFDYTAETLMQYKEGLGESLCRKIRYA